MTRNTGRKVFFLYPHSVVQEQMIDILIQSEFEVAVLRDHRKGAQLMKRFPGSLMFINIETGLSPEEWETYIRQMVRDSADNGSRVGVVVYNPDAALAERYLMDIGVHCGFIQLKLGLMESTKIVIRTLLANEARGDRRFVRVRCPDKTASINVKTPDQLIKGSVFDISSAGCAGIFPVSLDGLYSLDDLQLILRGTIIRTSGKLVGQRHMENDQLLQVIMFPDISGDNRTKIYGFIKRTLQAEIDAL